MPDTMKCTFPEHYPQCWGEGSQNDKFHAKPLKEVLLRVLKGKLLLLLLSKYQVNSEEIVVRLNICYYEKQCTPIPIVIDRDLSR